MLAGILLDFAIAGSMREAMRYTIVDAPVQFAFIVPALILACAAVRYGAEANIELVLPELYDTPGNVGAMAHLLPRAFALIVGLAVGYPMLHLGLDQLTVSAMVLGSNGAGYRALVFGIVAVVIGLLTAATRSLHDKENEFGVGQAGIVMRLGLTLLPLIAIVALAGTVLDFSRAARPTASWVSRMARWNAIRERTARFSSPKASRCSSRRWSCARGFPSSSRCSCGRRPARAASTRST